MLYLLRSHVVKAFLACLLTLCLLHPVYAQSLSTGDSSIQRVLVPEAARHFGIETLWKPAEWKLSLIVGEHRAEILIGSDRLIVDGHLMDLSEPISAKDGSISMPLQDSLNLFSRLLERDITAAEMSSAGLILQQQTKASESISIRSVHHISYPQFTRLIANMSSERAVEDVEVRCTEGIGRLTVTFPRARFARLENPIEVDDQIVELVEFAQNGVDAVLTVRTITEKYRYEVQKYDDPPRVVIDISAFSPPLITDYFGNSLFRQPDRLSKPEPPRRPDRFPFTTIVIDPGHGGKDHGARGRGGLVEKDVALDIALELKELIEADTGLDVVLTRTGDYFVSLKERAAIANHAKDGLPADLFISIHTNAHADPTISGFEAYYISDAIDPEAEATAALENAVIEFEREMNGSNDPVESSLIPILWDLQFTNFISQSSEFATLAQTELGKRLDSKNRGVRQAPFIVLAGVAMPAILIEVGFISNRAEEARLKTTVFRIECAEAIVAAVTAMKERHEIKLGQRDKDAIP